MSWTTLSHVTTGDLATAALQNSLIDDLAVLKTSIDDAGTLHGCARFLDGSFTEQTINNTSVETSVYSYAVPGGTLSTNKVIRHTSTYYMDMNTTSITGTLRVKWGGSTVVSGSIATTATTKGAFVLTVYLNANGATNSQRLIATVQQPNDNQTVTDGTFSSTASTIRTGAAAALAVDSTTNQTLQVTFQWTSAGANATFKRWAAVTELLTA